MDLLKLTFHILILTECYHSTKAMGLCDFADNFPCEDNGGSACFKNTGCHKVVPDKRTPPSQQTTKQFATEHSTLDSESTDEELLTTGHATTDQYITTTPLCPPNMVYANCAMCQGTCLDPEGCISNCTEPETCVCHDGFLFKGDNCVPEEQCGCFIEGKGVIPTDETYVNVDCTKKYTCENGVLNCNFNYTCGFNATCGVDNGIRQCYCNEGYMGDGETCSVYRDCYDLYLDGHRQDGVYTILPAGWPGSPFNVSCDMTTAEGGWTLFQRRTDGVTYFYRYWEDYKLGFGSFDQGRDFWLGNEQLYYLTNQKSYKLRVDIVTSNGFSKFEEYTFFQIGNESSKYRLSISYSIGNASNGMARSNGESFSTRDQDNDGCSYHDCAREHRGAWWYTSNWCEACYQTSPFCDWFQTNNSNCHNYCTISNLNGNYSGGNGTNVFWKYPQCNLKSAEMKLRSSSALMT